MEAAARQLDNIKCSDKTAEIEAMAAVQTGIGGNGNGSGSGIRRKLGMTIAAKRQRRDDSNGGINGLEASLVLLGSSGWE